MNDKKYKVLLVNGSPHLKGCVARAFDEVEKTLNENGVETERINIGNKDVRGCIACNFCRTHGRCVFNDVVNETAPRLAEADGLIVGTPVYYAGSNGQLHAFMDRLFYSTSGTIDLNQKVGATVVSSRRAGSTSAFDDLNHFFTMCSMPVVSSSYWNEVHGFTAEDVEDDLEGLQTMRNLARNAAFLIKAIRAQKEKEGLPEQEHTSFTNFHSEVRH
ncbi:MAG: flavodoxin family protein [Bacteroidales bacterium]|nr:flavodoxin family protein [Bacteroidales bacterium]MBD5281460.1 flavodoxin family protein [Bacteroides sp.]MBD5352730.1 flavodoxin family protein [Bacteroides sp.]MBD5360787.1 flavodoxin family protein [Bacteroides sp.]MBD5373842.1 flavodoxin family protein [Bacteroides sp.]